MHAASAAALWFFYRMLFTHVTVTIYDFSVLCHWLVYILHASSGIRFSFPRSLRLNICCYIFVSWRGTICQMCCEFVCVCRLCRTFPNAITVNARCLPMHIRVLLWQQAAVIGHVCGRGASTYCQVVPTSQGGFEFAFVLFAIMKSKTHVGTIHFTIASSRRQRNVTNKC